MANTTNTQNTTVKAPATTTAAKLPRGFQTLVTASQNATKDVISALGVDGLKDLQETCPTFGIYLNKDKYMAEGDIKTNQMIVDAIAKTGNMGKVLADMRKVIINGIATPDGARETDPKKIQKSKETALEYARILNIMLGQEKDQYMKEQAAEKGLTQKALVKAMNGNQRRSLFGLTVGVPMTVSAKNAFYKGLNTRLTKGVKANLITEAEKDEMIVSFSVDPDSKMLALSGIRKDVESPEQKAKREKAELEKKIEKAIDIICDVDADSQHRIFTGVARHSEKIAALMAVVLREVSEEEKEIAKSETESDALSEKKADLRVLKRQIEQSGKGNKKVSPAETKKLQTAFDKLAAELNKEGVNVDEL